MAELIIGFLGVDFFLPLVIGAAIAVAVMFFIDPDQHKDAKLVLEIAVDAIKNIDDLTVKNVLSYIFNRLKQEDKDTKKLEEEVLSLMEIEEQKNE